MNVRPRSLLGLVWTAAAGITLGTFVDASVWLYAATGSATLSLVRRAGPAAYAATLAVGLVGGNVVARIERQRDAPIAALAGGVPHCYLEGAVSEHAGELGTLLQVDRMTCDAGEITEGEVIAEQLVHDPGTRLAVDGWLLPLTHHGFDVARGRTGAAAVFHVADAEIVERPRGALALAAAFRRSLVSSIQGLEPRRGALLRGLTIGDTSGIDEGMEWEFRRTGLAHLVAVSGSNVAIVIAGAALLVRRGSPIARAFCCGVVLSLYVLVVGPEPSVLRATAMGGVALGGILVGRRAEPLQALGVALIVLVALRPALVSAVGLQLSAAATMGIVLWARLLAERLARFVPALVAYALAVTLAAQLAVAPIMVIVFGEVSLVAPLANVLAAPVVAPATVLGLLAGLAGLWSPVVGSWFAEAAAPFAAWVVQVADLLARPSWAAVECPAWMGWALAVPVGVAALVSATRAASRPSIRVG